MQKRLLKMVFKFKIHNSKFYFKRSKIIKIKNTKMFLDFLDPIDRELILHN